MIALANSDVDEVLRAFGAVVAQRERDIELERLDCLSHARAFALVLDPLRITTEEREQIHNCHHCQRLLSSFRRHIVHPSVWQLARLIAGRLGPDEANEARRHIENDGCRRCRLVSRSRWVTAITRGEIVVQAIRGAQEGELVDLASAPAALFATRAPDPFRLQVTSGAWELSVHEASGDTIALAILHDSSLAGRRVRVEVVGDEGSVERELTLAVDGARASLGSLADLARLLGGGAWALVAAVVD